MSIELQKRIITSVCLLSALILMFFYSFVLIILSIIIALISWIEFYALISKIYKKNNDKDKILKFFYKSLSLFYLMGLLFLIISTKTFYPDQFIIITYSLLVAIMSDIGGLVIGKFIKGKKLTKISPNKTISGSIGSFIFSLALIPFFFFFFTNYDLLNFILFTALICLSSQVGDLLVSFLKRKAKVKDTSDLLPGHGGVLDRLDGIFLAIPIGFILFNI